MKNVAAILAMIVLAGCSGGTALTMSDGEPGIQILPDISNCHGVMRLTVTGMSGAKTLTADCGEGFSLVHGRGDVSNALLDHAPADNDNR